MAPTRQYWTLETLISETLIDGLPTCYSIDSQGRPNPLVNFLGTATPLWPCCQTIPDPGEPLSPTLRFSRPRCDSGETQRRPPGRGSKPAPTSHRAPPPGSAWVEPALTPRSSRPQPLHRGLTCNIGWRSPASHTTSLSRPTGASSRRFFGDKCAYHTAQSSLWDLWTCGMTTPRNSLSMVVEEAPWRIAWTSSDPATWEYSGGVATLGVLGDAWSHSLWQHHSRLHEQLW